MCCATGCVSWLATQVFAFLHPAQHESIEALAKGLLTLIAFGCVALLSRKRKPDFAPAAAGGAP
jgi:hypothetical protein